MPSIVKPSVTNPGLERNALGLTVRDYEGGMSTLCAGCGHDSGTAAITQALWETDTPPRMIAKLSGIGLSAKTAAHFLRRQASAGADLPRRDGAPRARDHRRDLAVRDVQRPRGFDEELPVHAPARRADDGHRLRSSRGGDLGDHSRPGCDQHSDARRSDAPF